MSDNVSGSAPGVHDQFVLQSDHTALIFNRHGDQLYQRSVLYRLRVEGPPHLLDFTR